ncbi:hypothetical protein F4821DRAFT_239126 [Hypoxylon rubiginosum]|uniref:Uncharacterized protein n=1 Tax=Hypoxylon rubiginosum TaxID=110542 RepID=A0ACC0D110_9PEZI|nr:hypothetical protein F4821DRAFT_239126 [Hypoxylon rubiginosum]
MQDETRPTQLWAEDIPILNISVFPQGDLGADFRVKNPPAMDLTDPEQRANIIERRGKVDITCALKGVVHGREKAGEGAYYTLVVLEFRFEPNGLARRIKAAKVAMKFANIGGGNFRNDPQVVAVAPDGFFCVAPTTQNESKAKEGGGTAGVETGGAKAELSFKLEKVIESETWDAATVKGSAQLRGRNYGSKNTAAWALFENMSRTNGVASSLTTGILIKRKDIAAFRASVTVETTADTWTQVESIFSKDPEDDDVYFNPKKPSFAEFKVDENNLADFPIETISHVNFRTILLGTVEEKAQN